MIDNNYNVYSDAALAGMIADSSPHIIDSFAAESVIAFGTGVQVGTIAGKQVKPYAAGTFVGIALRDNTQTTGQYEAKAPGSVSTFGRVIVDTAAVAVTAGAKAYIKADGTFTNVATSAVEIGKFLTTGAGLQTLELKR